MIRVAKKEDIPSMIELIMIVLRDMELSLLNEISEKKIMEMLAESCLDAAYRFSPERSLVYELDGQVVGIVTAYCDSEEKTIDLAFQRCLVDNGYSVSQKLFTELEAFENEWYVDLLAVHPDFRSQGIGRSLLQTQPQKAKDAGLKKVGLNVDKQNTKAKILYENLGYQVVGECVLSGHEYDHMHYFL